MKNKHMIESLSDIQTIICLNVRNICIERNINMMKLAEDIDISYEYLRHLVSFNGKKSISLFTIYKISKYLNVPMEEFFKNIN